MGMTLMHFISRPPMESSWSLAMVIPVSGAPGTSGEPCGAMQLQDLLAFPLRIKCIQSDVARHDFPAGRVVEAGQGTRDSEF